MLFLLGSIFLSSCSMLENFFKYKPYARSVKKTQDGGVIALKSEHRSEDKELASQMMKEACGAKSAVIKEEGEVVVGSITNQLMTKEAANKKTKKGLFGLKFTEGHDGAEQTSSETIQKKEWLITYRCS
jgi:hypothetical protein